jgi:hypothetical protein
MLPQDISPSYIDLEATYYRHSVVMVTLTVGGKPGRFIVGLTSDRTMVRSGFLDNSDPVLPMAIEAGGKRLGSFVVKTTHQIPDIGADGVLGYDILKRYAVGFDRIGRIRLWLRNPAKVELEEWVGSGAKTLPLIESDDLHYLPVEVGGQKFYMLVTASSTSNNLQQKFADQAGFKHMREKKFESETAITHVQSGVVGGFAAGNSEWPWLFANITAPISGPSYAGQIRTVDFYRGRVVVDLGQDRLVHTPVKGKTSVIESLSNGVNLPLEERDGRMWVGNKLAPEWETFEGAEVLEYAGRSTAEWLKFLDRPASERLGILSELPQALIEHSVVLKLRDGKTVRVGVKSSL